MAQSAPPGGCDAAFVLDGDVSLRPFEPADVEPLHAAIEANRKHLAPWLPWAAAQGEHDTAGFVREAREQLLRNEGMQLAIVEGATIAGAIGFPEVDWPRRATRIGYWLSEDRQGRGTATAATRALVSHALGVWQLHRVEIRASAENRRSRAVPERLGFREEGTLRGAERIGHRHVDMVVYSMLAAEWPAARSQL
jgi:ribosomal-protein-serine acetyltransferase